MSNFVTDTKAEFTMNTGISRFVLISVALHLGLLGAVSFNWTRPPQLLPSTLTVMLSEPSQATASPFKRTHTVTRESTFEAGTHSRSKSTSKAPASFSQETNRDRSRIAADAASLDAWSQPSSDLSPTSPFPLARELSQGDATKNQVDSSDPRLNPAQEPAAEGRTKFPSPPGENAARGAKPWREGLDEGEGKQGAIQQASDSRFQDNDTAALTSQLAAQLRNVLAPYFTYPIMARRNGWEGQVQVGLRVEADGRLSHVRVAHSSGYRALDSAALTTLGRISIVPAAAGWLDGRHFDMVLPIEYRLIDGQS